MWQCINMKSLWPKRINTSAIEEIQYTLQWWINIFWRQQGKKASPLVFRDMDKWLWLNSSFMTVYSQVTGLVLLESRRWSDLNVCLCRAVMLSLLAWYRLGSHFVQGEGMVNANQCYFDHTVPNVELVWVMAAIFFGKLPSVVLICLTGAKYGFKNIYSHHDLVCPLFLYHCWFKAQTWDGLFILNLA